MTRTEMDIHRAVTTSVGQSPAVTPWFCTPIAAITSRTFRMAWVASHWRRNSMGFHQPKRATTELFRSPSRWNLGTRAARVKGFTSLATRSRAALGVLRLLPREALHRPPTPPPTAQQAEDVGAMLRARLAHFSRRSPTNRPLPAGGKAALVLLRKFQALRNSQIAVVACGSCIMKRCPPSKTRRRASGTSEAMRSLRETGAMAS